MRIINYFIISTLVIVAFSCGNTETYIIKPVINYKKIQGNFYGQDTTLAGHTIKVGINVDAEGAGNLIMSFKIEKIIFIDSLIAIVDTIPKKQTLNIDFIITQNEIDTTKWHISAMDKSNNLTEKTFLTFLINDSLHVK